ncbi:Dyp-type peroxidase [Streptomyces sp. DSM 41640]|uniref:Dyp-type peroxidase n=1 Tax=Streptomyces doebereineriae TaxID=3075528 RepID=A0ABU2VI96_9ACTN|nr:Dyp-type peroxidase domain-containing protein [Streptomyces sp. DSM 41640]MDT0485314.1 Dyp-type peroxidase [Streptomyces sp. DSM 41640]
MTRRSRRDILRATAATAVGVGALSAVGATAFDGSSSPKDIPTHLRGAAPLPYAEVVSLDLAAAQRADALRAAHRAITASNQGRTISWLALGESVLPHAVSRPRYLKLMPSFAGDVLDPARSHGDLLLQITGPSATAVQEASEQALRTLKQWQVRWRLDGQGLSRNPFHFTEGYGNPASTAEAGERALVKDGQGEPSWGIGGSYPVIRIIRLATDFWDRDTIDAQERIIGRRRDGRWLDATPTNEQPVFLPTPRARSHHWTHMSAGPPQTAASPLHSSDAATPTSEEAATAACSSPASNTTWKRALKRCSADLKVRPWPSTPSPSEAATTSSHRQEQRGLRR